MHKIILASGSPRRREILEQVGLKFTVCTSDIEEIFTKEKPEEIVIELASIKVNDVANKINESSIIIGSDTMVAVNGQVMGKPKDEEDAKNMIRKLQDNKHQVYTGVSVIIKEEALEQSNTSQEKNPIYINKYVNFVTKTDVWVNSMTEEQIAAYVETGEPYDKAGAYAIQGRFAIHINKIEGDYYNIVGFPIAKLYEVLLKEGIDLLK
jgi:septum formation protein